MDFNYDLIDGILASHGYKQQSIIAILQNIQEHYRYLPQEAFRYLAEKLDMSEAAIFSVATFYENFSIEPKGKYVIRVCDGTACHVRKSTPILDALKKDLKLDGKKRTTDDMLFTLETVSCLGACGLSPVMMINDEVHASMTPDKAISILADCRGKEGKDA